MVYLRYPHGVHVTFINVSFVCLQDVEPEWQTAASGVLVSLGRKFCNEVMEELLKKFQPGTLPHFFVVQTLANLSTANGRCC